MRVLLVDAYDSFTHNLAQALRILGARVEVVRCDAVAPEQVAAADRVVLGPGPGAPEEATAFLSILGEWAGRVPILGVCLGHQALAIALGGRVVRQRPRHGLPSAIEHDGTGLFAGVPPRAPMGRYHSLGVDPESLPPALSITAWSDDGVVMGLAHRDAPLWGVQFHPESVMSGEPGLRLLDNYLSLGARAALPAAAPYSRTVGS